MADQLMIERKQMLRGRSNNCKTLSVYIFFISIVCFIALDSGGCEKMSKLVGLDFEVFGRVQGVFFRKYTQKQGKELGLRGWCMNTDKGTVVGRIEGEKSKVDEMKYWLQHTGSPESEIDKAEFRNEKELNDYSLEDFKIRK